MVKAIVFDLDGTLIDTNFIHLKACRQTFKKYGAKVPDEKIISHFGEPMEVLAKEVLEENKLKGNYRALANEKKKNYLKLLNGRKCFFPETKKTISILKKKFKICIFTGSARVQINALGNFLKEFEIVIAGTECIKPKPHPDTLFFIAKKLNLKPADCAFVGDMPIDMKTGKNSGYCAIGIESKLASRKKLVENGADKVIKSLKELLVLKQLQ